VLSFFFETFFLKQDLAKRKFQKKKILHVNSPVSREREGERKKNGERKGERKDEPEKGGGREREMYMCVLVFFS